jgi:hypothetical protein
VRHRLSEPAGADDSDVHLPSLLELGGEQVAHREAAVRSPALCYLDHLFLCWEVVEPVQPLNRVLLRRSLSLVLLPFRQKATEA